MRAVSNAIRNAWRGYRSLTGARRELTLLALLLAFALLVLPFIIWAAGQFFLGDYVRDLPGTRVGGPLALLVDYVRGLAAGAMGYWIVLLGPYVLFNALRACRAVWKM
jgi:hypothetical protein